MYVLIIIQVNLFIEAQQNYYHKIDSNVINFNFNFCNPPFLH